MRKKILTALLILGTCFTGTLYAQKELSVEDAVKIGLEQNRDIKISILKAKSVGDARINEVQASRLPSLKLFASYTRLSDIGTQAIPVPIPNLPPFSIVTYFPDNYSAKLSLTQPIFTGFRLANQQSVAEHNSNAAKEDVKTEQRGIIFTIKQEYWELYKLQQTLDAVSKDLDEAKSHLEDAKNDFASGTILQNDVLKTQVQVSNIELTQLQTQKSIQIAMSSLMNTLGLPLDTKVTLTTKPDEQLLQSRQLPELIDEAKSRRSELTAMDERIQAGEASVNVAKAGYYPQLSLGADLLYQNPNQRYFPAQNVFKTTWDASVNLSWDLWTWNTPGYQTDEAEYSLEEMQETKKQSEEAIALEVTQDFLSEQTSVDQIRVAKLTVDQATENLRVVKAQFSKGVVTNTDVLDAETLLMQAQVNYFSAVADGNVAAARLKESIGE
ncbi:MAG TPA: TolC family protein [Candidatus Kapabacteria bacterium]|nr:TolC family protein [Candidatus Kapabacteria bacterium]